MRRNTAKPMSPNTIFGAHTIVIFLFVTFSCSDTACMGEPVPRQGLVDESASLRRHSPRTLLSQCSPPPISPPPTGFLSLFEIIHETFNIDAAPKFVEIFP